MSKPRRTGRPPVRDPAETFAGRPYLVTTFRLNKRTVAKADAIDRELDLGSRTAAVQYAVDQVFERLVRTRGRRVERDMRAQLEALTRLDDRPRPATTTQGHRR